MAIVRYHADLTRSFDAPRQLLWELIADSDRWDRMSGLKPPSYSYEMIDGDRVRVAEAKEMGIALKWVEPPYRWIRGSFLEGERRFISGPAKRGGFSVVVDEADGKSRVKATAWVEVDSLLAAAVALVVRRKFQRSLKVLFDSVEELVRGQGEAAPSARHLLLSSPGGELVPKPSSTNIDALEARLARLSHRRVPQKFISVLREYLRRQPDETLSQMKPAELARLWGVGRRDCLRSLLHATEVGLVDLKWQINCPVCQVSAGVVEHLSEVGRDVHCDGCNIGYGVDFADNVEAVFLVNPAIRAVTPLVFCESTPMFRPHVYAQLTVEPGSTSDFRPPTLSSLPVGRLNVRVLNHKDACQLEIEHGQEALSIQITEDGLTATAAGDSASQLSIANQASETRTVLIETVGASPDMTSGAYVATFPEFTTLFATEAPASGVELRVGRIALLFSDLTGSTALYEQVGDARAFAIVEQHFRVMRRVIEENDGTVIKTMGDAVMASFASEGDAVRAAIAVGKAHEGVELGDGVGVKLGVHAGPCLAVRANERLDFFGTTVNVTARLQGTAQSGELVVAESMLESASVRDLLADFPKRAFSASLKGIENDQALFAFTVA